MNHTNLQVSDIPDNIMREMRQQFDSVPKIANFYVRIQQYKSRGQFIEALSLSKQVEEMFSHVVTSYIEEANRETEQISLATADLPDNDARQLVNLIVTLNMAVDIIDSSLMDFDDVLHRTHPGFSLKSCDDLRSLAKMVKLQLSTFNRQTSFLNYPHWGDIVDNMYDMMKNKARSIINKTRNEKL